MCVIYIHSCLSLSLSVSGLGGADVVLSCSYIEEGGGMGGMGGIGGGAMFSRTPSTLVLRDMAETSDLETVTPYNPPETPNADDLIFEVKVSSVEIPGADILLHADCNEQEVTCEISQYIPRGKDPDALPAHFIGSLQVVGGGLSLTIVLQTLSEEETESGATPLIQSKLKLPLSQSGTLLTQTVYVVYSRSPSVAAPIGGDAALDCGFRQQNDMPPQQEVGLEWRLQHKGHGRRILELKAKEAEGEEGSKVDVEREGASADSALLVSEGNASLSLTKLKVSDEGTYICTVGSGDFQTQQVIQLQITQPPRVSLSEEKLTLDGKSPQKLSCHCHRYYPLDVKVEWLSFPPSAEEAVDFSEEASLSSHRQHSDGTFSLSSHLFLRPSEHPPGTVVTCRVSHPALDAHTEHSLTVETPAEKSYWMILVMLVLTGLFFYQLLK
ncbi:tapasin-related protein [Chanos chanos]|uniref:Tapasin-related protein n=1 Tax=Chanos chanos TaxID=29144 RepID=A0A6J2WBQ8_CHACN|nr:tapasin-related protein [Chanos chanos]